MASATYGTGKVVVFGDSSPCDDGSGDNNDNLYDGWVTDANGNHRILIMNATIWLATSNGSSIIENNSTTKLINYGNSFKINTENYSGKLEINVFDISGRKIYSNENLISEQEFEIQNIENGIYIYQIKVQNSKIVTGKFLIAE